jgi:hypothetical protein
MLTNLDFAINLKQNPPSSLEYPELANSERVLPLTSNKTHPPHRISRISQQRAGSAIHLKQNPPSPLEYPPIRLPLGTATPKNLGGCF